MEREAKLSLKLLIDPSSNKVLFAEANKDFVDFLFHIMSLPLGTVTRLLSSKDSNMMGSLGHLYKSIESLSLDFTEPRVSKDTLLKPISVCLPPLSGSDSGSTSANHTNPTPKTNKLYICRNVNLYSHSLPSYPLPRYMCRYVSDAAGVVCPKCNVVMSFEMSYCPPKVDVYAKYSNPIGYVKGVVSYMVMDNLEVKPMSTISALSLIKKFNVKDVTCLVEKQVQVGFHEGIAILKGSLETQSVLSTVFLENVKSARGAKRMKQEVTYLHDVAELR